jgi:hypothetical protein
MAVIVFPYESISNSSRAEILDRLLKHRDDPASYRMQDKPNAVFSAHRTMAEDKERAEQSAARPGNNEISEAEIDQNLMGTFPASDPPSWTLGVERSEKSASEYSAEQR